MTELTLKFEELAYRTIRPSAKEILKTLSQDLTAINLQVLSKFIGLIENIVNDNEFFFELAVVCRDKIYSHPEWSKLSGRVRMMHIKSISPKTFRGSCELLKPILSSEFYVYCIANSEILETFIDRGLDWDFDIFAAETLFGGYLSKIKDKNNVTRVVETPQYLYLRVATFLWYDNVNYSKCVDNPYFSFNIRFLESIKQCYLDLASGKLSAPSPMQFNAGMKRPQLSSCFLISISDDMRSISKSWHDSAIISMNNGGLGLCYDSLRHSEIGHNGWSKGIVPWIKVQNEILSTVDQAGRRKGSGTMYICDWHRDIEEFIDLKDPLGKDEMRARELFYAIMISDLFMERVRDDGMWSLFCPAKSEELEKTYGKVFEEKYKALEFKGLSGELPLTFRQIKARDLWKHIMLSQIKTGMPFIIYKDAVNRKSNQQNLGTIRCSNLCTEIMQYTDADNIASCNLSSIPISEFVKFSEKHPQGYFDFEELGLVTRRAVRNLGQTIDRNYYPEDVPQIKSSNMKNRPIGIGIQDLAGTFAKLDLCWGSEKAKSLNLEIARSMYYHGMDENIKMAEEFGHYENFPGSPASEGLFQFDLWEKEKCEKLGIDYEISKGIQGPGVFDSNIYDFDALRTRMVPKGLYFSLLFAQMPTASSAHIRGNNESIEPYSQLLSTRTVLSGQFVLCVPQLVSDLEKIGLWNDKMLHHLFLNHSSIQTFPEDDLEPPVAFRLSYLKLKYKTAYELSQKILVDLYLDRAPYQCQSSSNNVFMSKPTMTSLNAYHFAMWMGGSKTGMYYLRSKAGSEPINFSLDSLHVTKRSQKLTECLSCQL